MINLANTNITGIKLGNDEIARVYLGSDLIYQNDIFYNSFVATFKSKDLGLKLIEGWYDEVNHRGIINPNI